MKSVIRNGAFWIIATVGTLTFLGTWRLLFPGRPFDPVVWHQVDDPNDISRRDMADRLIARRTLIGKSKDEIVQMLGSPTDYDDSRITFRLGPERGFISIDSEWLVLILGPDGRVVRAFTEED